MLNLMVKIENLPLDMQKDKQVFCSKALCKTDVDLEVWFGLFPPIKLYQPLPFTTKQV